MTEHDITFEVTDTLDVAEHSITFEVTDTLRSGKAGVVMIEEFF
jgi:hypothetical protein